MYFNEEEMRNKLFDAIDPNSTYSLEDFNNDYTNVNHTASTYPTEFKIPVKFVNKSENPNPEYATNGAAGFDFRANLNFSVLLNPGEIKIIPTGLYFELPEHVELQVRPRSGLAAKHGITVLNSPGTVDSDYRGEVKVILVNHGSKPFVIENNDRIAQGVLNNVLSKTLISFDQVNELGDTERGDGGFGSTGVN